MEEEKLKRFESFKKKLQNSRFRKFCLERFTTEINLQTSTHSDVHNWFENYLSHHAYAFEIIMANIANGYMKKEAENTVDEEYIKDIDNFIELMIELKSFLKENKTDEKV